MAKLKLLLVFAVAVGCGPDAEIERLKQEVATMKAENATLREMVPSERPAVLKELDDAKLTIEKFRKEVEAAKASAQKASDQVPAEIVPLATIIRELKERVTVLERTASMKGHTHEYRDSYPLGTVHSSTRTTVPDK